ncbi:ATP-binding protein [Ralstonia insidiosa]|uniref:histidine kinase n=1 Tax=Ralstonia insidiosa TaxID=190721 RepID=A0A848P1B8_9RALS|nr:ATP-binding protein [Ralstonia insidiosa]NMV37458.1 hybrid sensor histidine kinase/response regulator [Ralstonia insidiosa]
MLSLLMALVGRAACAEPVDVGRGVGTDTPSLALLPTLSMLEDKTGQLDLRDALASTRWQSISGEKLTPGYSASSFWLRGMLYNSGAEHVTRWLAVGPARLESVDYFRLAPGEDAARETVLAGNRLPLSTRAVAATIPVFPVTLAPGERVTFVLRIGSRSAIDLDPRLWEPTAFRQQEGLDLMLQAFLVGPALLLALYALIQGWSWRDRAFLRLFGWISLAVLYNMAIQGYLYRYVLQAGGEWVLRAPSTLGVLTTVFYAATTMAFVGLGRIASWKWLYRIVIMLLLVGGVWTALGDYRAGAIYSNVVVASFNVLWAISMADAWRRGLPNARLFMLSFGVVWLVQVIGLLEIHGILSRGWHAGLKLSWLVELATLLMMGALVVRRSRETSASHAAMQQALLDAKNQEQLKLEHAVVERTQELRTALIDADEANRAKTDFLARISHDLRTPLTSIIGFAELVQAAGHENGERGRIIGRSARHMLAMVNDLIDYARGGEPDALHSAPVYVHALLDAVVQEGAELARRRGNQFSFRIERPLPPVLELDAKGLRRVLGNLLDNATKYTTSGSIELLIDCEGEVQIGQAVRLTLIVKDTGPGIAPEDQQRIFEPFQRLDTARTQPGTGLGLAIVRQWIERMGGTLKIDSALGAGTSMRLDVTATVAAEDAVSRHHVADIGAVAPSIDGSGLTIWIAEDTADIRRLLADELSSLGFAVETASDGVSIIERMAQAGDARPDLVLTDYLMPGADGFAVLVAARQHLPGVPVVVLSAIPLAASANDGPATPAFDASLLKPINLAELQEALMRLLGLLRLPPVADASEAAPLVGPPPQARAVALALIDLGAISDLIDWADALHTEYPQCEAFAMQVRQLATRGDLAGLQRLCS